MFLFCSVFIASTGVLRIHKALTKGEDVVASMLLDSEQEERSRRAGPRHAVGAKQKGKKRCRTFLEGKPFSLITNFD